MKYYMLESRRYNLGGVITTRANTFTHFADKRPGPTRLEVFPGMEIYRQFFTDPVEAEECRQRILKAAEAGK